MLLVEAVQACFVGLVRMLSLFVMSRVVLFLGIFRSIRSLLSGTHSTRSYDIRPFGCAVIRDRVSYSVGSSFSNCHEQENSLHAALH